VGERSQPSAGGQLGLWFGVLAGPLAWSAQLLVNYFVVSLACHGQLSATALAHEAVSLATGLLVLAALLVARRRQRALARLSTAGAPPTGRSAFLARTGVLMSALFLFVIVAGAVPTLVLPACV
jgi:hypothetical protein